MKLKLLAGIAATCCLALCGCGAGGTGETGGTGGTAEPHEHSYQESVVSPAHGVQGCVLHACSCGESYRDGFLGALGKEMPTEQHYSFLFIGNSYTYVNELWTEFRRVAKGEGYTDVTVDSVTQGAYTLESFADPADQFGAQVEAKLSENEYDFVFLQEQSLRPARYPAQFYQGVNLLHERIKKTGARDILYMTWGRKEGSAELKAYRYEYEELVQRLAAAYESAGEKAGIPVSPVGAAFFRICANHPEIELYQQDMSHPSIAGTYLAALCHYATVFGKSPVGASYIPDYVPKEQAEALQQAAHDAVFGDSIVKVEYRNEYRID